MQASPLYLSHWEASPPVCVAASCVSQLKNYNIMGIRFLYNCYRKQQKGAILNHEDGMNFQIQVSAFLNAVSPSISSKNPVLIICTDETLCNWHYHLTNHGGFNVTILSNINVDDILESDTRHNMILSTVDATAALRKIKVKEFLCVVIDQFDKLIAKSIVKQVRGCFKIGLTHRNFMKQPDQKLFWTMLNWSNPGVLGKFTEFCEIDDEHLQNLRYPYDEWWQRLTWKYCNSFILPSEHELKEYHTKLKAWSRSHNIYGIHIGKYNKRKLPDSNNTKSSKILRISPKREASSIQENELLLKKETKIEPNSDIDKEPLNDSTHSNDTIIYDFKESPIDHDDEDFILSSIIRGKNLTDQSNKVLVTSNDGAVTNTDSDILTSVMETSSTSKKKELLSLLYGDED